MFCLNFKSVSERTILFSCFVFCIICGEIISLEIPRHSNIKNRTVTWDCNSTDPIDSTNVNHLIINCSLPHQIPYATYLSNSNSSTKLNRLTLNIGSNSTILNSTHFENLTVEILVVNFIYENKTGKEGLLQVSSDVLYQLNSVTSLEFDSVVFYEVKTIGKNYGSKCSLERLQLTRCNIRGIPNAWLQPCDQLKALIISIMKQRNGTKEIRRKLLNGAKSLIELEIHDCYIEELNDEMEGLVNLRRLDVSRNQVHYALTSTVLPSLRELDLSYNHIFSSALFASGVEKQPNLRVVSLDYNTVLDICDSLGYRLTVDDEPSWHEPLQGRDIEMSAIQRLSLRGTITTDMCFGNMIMDSLEYFDLSDSKITAFHFGALPVTKLNRLEVNVTGCPIKDMPGESFTQKHYKDLRFKELRITGLNVTLECDCKEYLHLWQAVRERRLILDTALCSNGVELAKLPDEQLMCDKYACGVCVCRRFWKQNATDVKCNGELRTLPRQGGLRKLYASMNQVENITADDIPDTLIYLDLRYNRISRMSEEASNKLFVNKNMKLLMFGNPIICDCENKPLILALMDHYTQVLDYPELQCVDQRYVKDVVPDYLCFTTSRAFTSTLVGSLAAMIGLLALVLGLYYRYGQAMKVYLFSRGLFLFCIREDELDADRPFDAFVSFSHKDEAFVENHLLPGLECEPYQYKLLVHYRNWVAGELIPTQINKSVDLSKKTIIVLSKNFLESIWGLLEFRTAHLSAIRDGRARVIIIILDDILEGKLDGELRSYLRTNTYVKWGDPWFWDKIRYALPHGRNTNTSDFAFTTVSPTNSSQMNTRETASTDSAIEMDRF